MAQTGLRQWQRSVLQEGKVTTKILCTPLITLLSVVTVAREKSQNPCCLITEAYCVLELRQEGMVLTQKLHQFRF